MSAIERVYDQARAGTLYAGPVIPGFQASAARMPVVSPIDNTTIGTLVERQPHGRGRREARTHQAATN